MNVIKKTVIASILSLFIILCCSCDNDPDDLQNQLPVDEEIVTDENEQQDRSDEELKTDNTETENDSEAYEDKDEEAVPEEIPDSPYKNMLSGLSCDEEIQIKRPVAVMINNIKQAIPQIGIYNADVLYECIVEGGITRLMALYSDVSCIGNIGSVRSSRDYYIDIAQSHDAIYAHAGGSPDAYEALSSRKINNIDGVNGPYAASAAYWRDTYRMNNMGYEHSLLSSGQKLINAITALGYRTEIYDGFRNPFAFYDEDTEIDGTNALSVNIMFSGNYANSFFDFDKKTRTYKKGQYAAAHVDGENGKTLEFKNIIILGVTYQNTFDDKNRLDMYFTGTGNGYYITNGKAKKITWKKADRQSPYSLYEEDATTPLYINRGKTYVGLSNGIGCVSIYDSIKYSLIQEENK